MPSHRRSLQALNGFVLAMLLSTATASNTMPPKGYGYDGKTYSSAAQACGAYARDVQGSVTGSPEYVDGNVRCAYKDSTGFASKVETISIECPDESNPSALNQCMCWNDKVASGNRCVPPEGAERQTPLAQEPKAVHKQAPAASADEPAFVLAKPEVLARVRTEGSLTQMANEIKALGQKKGATVQVVLAKLPDGGEVLVAGINTGASGWTRAQRDQLGALGINIAPDAVPKGQLKLDNGGAPHAEENMGAFLKKIGARGERWSKAVVGEVKPGGSSYVCKVCQGIVSSAGGHVEEPAPKVAPPPMDKPLRPPGK